MNSGKSTALLQAAFNYEERGHQVLLAKPAVDTKGDREHRVAPRVVREVDFTIEPDGRRARPLRAQRHAGDRGARVAT